MKIVEKRPEALRPYKNNPRINDGAVEAVAASIREFGFKVPIVIDPDGEIICGHTRHKAALQLHLKTVPCVVADDLSDEQIKAFRLADNKTAELADWDISLLNAELKEVCGIDMEEFGFPGFDDDDEDEEDEDGYYGDERERTFDNYKLEHFDPNRTAGRFELPTLERCDYVPHELIGFNYVLNTTARDKGVHFFLDDYQFERIWNEPIFYLQKLVEFPCMCTPDFSLYTDMPLAMKIWNVYRSRLIGQMAADHGIQVVPTLQWAGEDTLDWVFEGIEKGGTVATSTVGAMKDKEALRLWKLGMERALAEVEPTTLVLYGTDVDFDFGGVNVVKVESRKFADKERL